MFNSSICILSNDDTTKGKLGPPAASRYHQIRRYFLGTHTPNMPDHDFLMPGYLLSVFGYIYPATLSKYSGIGKSWSGIFGVCVPRKYRRIWWYLDAAGGTNVPLVTSSVLEEDKLVANKDAMDIRPRMIIMKWLMVKI